MAKGKEQKSLLILFFLCEICVTTAEIFLFCTNLFPSPWLVKGAHILSFYVWLMPIPSQPCQSCLILVEMWSIAAMQPQFFIGELGRAFSQGGARCPASLHTPHWSWGLWHEAGDIFPIPFHLTQFRPCKSHQRCFGSDSPSFELPVPGTAPLIIAPEGFGITKPQLCFISQKLFCLLKADVERGWPARGQGLNPLLPYICVYRFHNAGFGSESLTLCVQALNPHLWSRHVLAQHM